jgi:hypothetical protein
VFGNRRLSGQLISLDATSSAETPILLVLEAQRPRRATIREIRQSVTAVTATAGASREIARA